MRLYCVFMCLSVCLWITLIFFVEYVSHIYFRYSYFVGVFYLVRKKLQSSTWQSNNVNITHGYQGIECQTLSYSRHYVQWPTNVVSALTKGHCHLRYLHACPRAESHRWTLMRWKHKHAGTQTSCMWMAPRLTWPQKGPSHQVGFEECLRVSSLSCRRPKSEWSAKELSGTRANESDCRSCGMKRGNRNTASRVLEDNFQPNLKWWACGNVLAGRSVTTISRCHDHDFQVGHACVCVCARMCACL